MAKGLTYMDIKTHEKLEKEYSRLQQLADSGYEWWNTFSSKVKFDSQVDVIVIISSRFIDYYVEIVEWILSVKKNRGHDRVFMIVDTHIARRDKELHIVEVDKYTMKSIIQLCKLAGFTRYIYPVIFEDPFGNLNMLGKEAKFIDYLNGVAK